MKLSVEKLKREMPRVLSFHRALAAIDSGRLAQGADQVAQAPNTTDNEALPGQRSAEHSLCCMRRRKRCGRCRISAQWMFCFVSSGSRPLKAVRSWRRNTFAGRTNPAEPATLTVEEPLQDACFELMISRKSPCHGLARGASRAADKGTPLKMATHCGLFGQFLRRFRRANLDASLAHSACRPISSQMMPLRADAYGSAEASSNRRADWLHAITESRTTTTRRCSVLHLGPLISCNTSSPRSYSRLTCRSEPSPRNARLMSGQQWHKAVWFLH
jgi:hypothetical protein